MATLRRAGLTAAAGLAVLASGCGSHHAASGPGAAKARRPASATAAASPGSGTPGPTAPGAAGPLPRCHISQLAVAFTGLSAASGGRRDLRLILTNRSSLACHVYGYPGLGFLTVTGLPRPTKVRWAVAPHATVALRPAANAHATLTWQAASSGALQLVAVTLPDETAPLESLWPGGPVLGDSIAAGPLRAAPAGPVPTGTGTVADAPGGILNGMCMTVNGLSPANGTAVVASACPAGYPAQVWTAYSDGTLRISGTCLAVTGAGAQVGATAETWACTGAASQQWDVSQASGNPFGGITNGASGNAFTDPAGSTANGTPLQLAPARGDLDQPWHASFRPYPNL